MFSRSKYKKILGGLLEEPTYNAAGVAKLAHYVELTPVKVPKIFAILSRYYEEHAGDSASGPADSRPAQPPRSRG